MTYKITILGCGNAAGTPAIGNYWGDCDPSEPRNRRLRASLAVQSAKTTLIVDTGPDFRHQLNRVDINDVDAAIYTHAHSDHISGIDDLRMFFFRRGNTPIPIYGSVSAMENMRGRFDYVFDGGKGSAEKFYVPFVHANEIEKNQMCKTMTIGDIEFTPFEQDHTTCTSLGFRFNDFAYSTDMLNLCDESIEALQGIKIWLVDGAGHKKTNNTVHASFQDIIALNERIGAEKVYFTHLTPFMDYQTMMDELPDGYEPAYDGLVFDV